MSNQSNLDFSSMNEDQLKQYIVVNENSGRFEWSTQGIPQNLSGSASSEHEAYQQAFSQLKSSSSSQTSTA